MSRLLGGGLLALCALALYITGRSEQAPRIVSISSPVGSGMGGRWPHGGGAPKPVDGFDINNPAELLAHAVLPVNIVANAMRNQRTAAASKPAPKPCPADCVKNGGVCNPGLGECSCPPFMGGASCGSPLLSECAALVGMVQTAAAPVASPCLIDGRSRAPVSCECLRACESLGVMGNRACYVMNAANESLMRWVQQQRNQRGLEANSEYFAATLAPLAGQSKERCSGHGVWAPAGGMPAKGVPAGKCEKKGSCRCLCYPGYDGDACERSTAVVPRHFCLNGCSGRGECFRNWCRCEPGFYGIDCSLGAAPKGASPPPPLPPPIGAQDGKWAAGAPRLYVYELPGRFGSWLQAGSHGWWQDMDLWGEDVVIHRRALRSAYRVLDPEQADYFLVPVHVSSGMWQLNWGFRDLLPTGVRVHEAALQYIKESGPFWSRKGGADHLWVFGHDQGAWRIRAKLPELEASIFINVFGAAEAQRGGHRHGHDIVCPPVLYSGVPAGLLNHHGRQRIANPPLAFFQGKLNLHIPCERRAGGGRARRPLLTAVSRLWTGTSTPSGSGRGCTRLTAPRAPSWCARGTRPTESATSS